MDGGRETSLRILALALLDFGRLLFDSFDCRTHSHSVQHTHDFPYIPTRYTEHPTNTA